MIRLVEKQLGAPIFNRNADPISLTYAGQKYMDAARQVLAINRNLAREIEELNQEEQGTIRLGIPVQRAMQLLPYVLPKFKTRYPYVDIDLQEHGSAVTETLLLEGGGIINGAFLEAGLIDELSVLIYPGLNGVYGSDSIIGYQGRNPAPAEHAHLQLIAAQTLSAGMVHLHYRIEND